MPFADARDGTEPHVENVGSDVPVILVHGSPLAGDMVAFRTLRLLKPAA